MITLDGHSLTIEELVQVARDPTISVARFPSMMSAQIKVGR